MIVYQKQKYSGRPGIFLFFNYFFFLPLSCQPLTITNIGLAKKIDEYVPKIIPTVSVIANNLVLEGPKKTRANSTKIVVREVIIDLV